jgi:hypothetical protein
MDATLVETVRRAMRCAVMRDIRRTNLSTRGGPEQGLVVHTEFRDGNVPAGFEQRRVLEEALKNVPKGVKKVRMRSDTAGYQHQLLRYCDEEENKWCGRIEFTVGCDVSVEFKKAVLEVAEEDWTVLKKRDRYGELTETPRQWAEVCFVPNAIGHSKRGLSIDMWRFGSRCRIN